MIYGIQTKITKEINLKKLTKIITKKNANKVNSRLKEYDNIKKLIHNFLKKNYKFVSFVHGGFKDIHDESLNFNIPLLNHDESCSICMKKNKKNKQKSGFLFKLFGKSKKDKNKPQKKPGLNINSNSNTQTGNVSTSSNNKENAKCGSNSSNNILNPTLDNLNGKIN